MMPARLHWLTPIVTGALLLAQPMLAPAAHAQQRPVYLDEALLWINEETAEIDALPKGATFFDDDRLHWINIAFSTALSLIDTDLYLTRTQRNLTATTPCLQASASLLEARAEEVRQKLQQAERDKDILKILRFKSVLREIDALTRSLLRNGTNPMTVDEGWYLKHQSDEGFCCAPNANMCAKVTAQSCKDQGGRFSYNPFECRSFGCQISDEEIQMCPFDTDYLPPSIEGYGCDVDAMDRIITDYLQDYPAIADILQQERSALLLVQQTAEDQYAQAKAFAIAQAGIDALVRGEEPVLPDDEPIVREHQRVYGCESQQCLNGDQSACRTLTGAVLTEKRGPFSLETDHLRLLQTFQDVRAEMDEERPGPPSVTSDSADSPMDLFFKRYGQQLFRNVSTDQSKTLSRLFALGVDPQLSVNESLLPFRQAVQRLARLVATPDGGLRAFTRDFAYFLRRTCLDRPCNERLERVLRINFKNECFPYTTGAFRTTNERENCRAAAELDEAPYQ